MLDAACKRAQAHTWQ